MCQLMGMNCNAPTDVTFSFRGFAHRGGHTDHHSDGWGIAFFEGEAGAGCDKGLRHFVDHQPASSSPVAELISHYPIKSRNVIAHIRKATQGRVALENCHPLYANCGAATGSLRITATLKILRRACTAASGRSAVPTASGLFAGSCRSWPNRMRMCQC